ncbi:MAG: hypothetical protein PWQ20_1188 [Thermotogaceae bacterium]|nr:hypothetical protein [Thermotogaceae bacterium]MDN5338118.1 hypothetical protein [Thermotogaceae bacterium]
MVFKISSDWLNRFLKVAEKLIGNIDPSFKKINFYHDNGNLKAFVTDGCIKFETPVINLMGLPYDFIIPLEPLKLILKDEKSEFVKFELKEKQVVVNFGNQTLALPTPDKVNRWENSRKNTEIFEWKLSELVKLLDIGSIVCREEDYVTLNIEKDRIVCLGSDGRHIAAGISMCKTSINNFSGCIPYVSARHIVKASEGLKTENISLFISDSGINITLGKARLMLCYRTPEPFHLKLVEFGTRIISETSDEKILIKTSDFRKAITKLCSFVKRESVLINCSITKENMELSSKGESFYYSFKVPLLKGPESTAILLKFSPLKVRRFLSKSFSEEFVFEIVRKRYVVLKRKKGDLYMIMRTERLET